MPDEQQPPLNIEPAPATEPESAAPDVQAAGPGPAAPDAWAAEPYPFWGYSDIFLFAGLAVPCVLLGMGVVKGLMLLLNIHPGVRVLELLPQQALGYGLLFGALALILRIQYDKPFWESLAWQPARLPFLWNVIFGLATALVIAMLSSVIRTPTTPNPMTEMMSDRLSVTLLAIFGVSIAPLTEELAFRGFLQPVLVRSLGVAPGIIAAALPFGLLHFQEYGNSWHHVVLISAAGSAFGWMRHATGSTRAAVIMHSAYNALFFIAQFARMEGLPSNG